MCGDPGRLCFRHPLAGVCLSGFGKTPVELQLRFPLDSESLSGFAGTPVEHRFDLAGSSAMRGPRSNLFRHAGMREFDLPWFPRISVQLCGDPGRPRSDESVNWSACGDPGRTPVSTFLNVWIIVLFCGDPGRSLFSTPLVGAGPPRLKPVFNSVPGVDVSPTARLGLTLVVRHSPRLRCQRSAPYPIWSLDLVVLSPEQSIQCR